MEERIKAEDVKAVQTSRKNQCSKIIEYMKERGSINTYDAIFEMGCTRLASRISDLKKQGYAIASKFVKRERTNWRGEKIVNVFKEYTLCSAEEGSRI